jgi:hypothetical protein
MSYSRRELYAMGEPLGESVTRKEGGRIIYGGGGGGESKQTQTQIVDLPEWARGTAQKQLALTESVTDINKNPFQTYGDFARKKGMDPTQVAGFQGLQNRAFEGAENLQPSGAIGAGMGLTGAAGMRALGTQYNPYATGQFGAQAGQYMDPYMQNVVGIQQREAQRASEMQRNQNQAQAVQQGAFGGSRQAIVEAERQRNLGTQMGDIQARGLQDAYSRGQQQFNTEQQLREQSRQYGAGLGMQGLQTALQSAGQLGQLGGQQFGQQKDILGLQNQFGTQQQQQEQALINARMQDFQAERRYPYQQLEFMSNVLRGTPMGTVQSLYTPQPGIGQQVLGAGTSLAGAYMMGGGKFAQGGPVNAQPAGLAELALSKM